MSSPAKVLLACPRVPEAVALAAGRLKAAVAADVAAHSTSCRACKTTLRLCEEAVRSGRLPAAFRAVRPAPETTAIRQAAPRKL
jgi:hypothetical protein